MRIVTLYTGNGVSYSQHYTDGMTKADRVRLVADDGMLLTNDGINFYSVIDVETTESWYEVKNE